VGPVPINDGIGKEIISKFTSSLHTGKVSLSLFPQCVPNVCLGLQFKFAQSSKRKILTDIHHSLTYHDGFCHTGEKGRSKCYTDSNGREFMERVFNYRPTWDLEVRFYSQLMIPVYHRSAIILLFCYSARLSLLIKVFFLNNGLLLGVSPSATMFNIFRFSRF